MPEPITTGWDVGGAHLKVAQAAGGGILVARQVPCRLWLGVAHLHEAIAAVRPHLRPSARHAITMTGELADIFADRAEGVARIAAEMGVALAGADARVYAGADGFLPLTVAADRVAAVASANWHASAALAADRLPEGTLVDVGSTTTDVAPFAGGRVRTIARGDAERMIAGELVYTGATRTPVMAMADRVPFAGALQPLMAELFATAADVHRLTGELPTGADLLPTADGRGTSLAASAGRLARMLGRDAGDAGVAAWRGLAHHLAQRQRDQISMALTQVLNRGASDEAAPLVGAGIGRFLLPSVAEGLGRSYVDLAELIPGAAEVRAQAADCAPAAALAILVAAP